MSISGISDRFSSVFKSKSKEKTQSPQLDFSQDDNVDIFSNNGNMANSGSPNPFVKDEPNDQFDPNRFMTNNGSGYTVPQQQLFGMGNSQFGGGIDPSELTMNGGNMSMQNGSYMQSYPFSQQHMSSSFNLGGSGITNDELEDLVNLNGVGNDQVGFDGGNGFQHDDGSMQFVSNANMGMNRNSSDIYSHTPEGAPIQSPFVHGQFNYDQFRSMPQQQQRFGHHMHSSSLATSAAHRSGDLHATSFDTAQSLSARVGLKMHPGVERKSSSNSRSPMTPKTPALGVGNLTLGTPESGSFPIQGNHVRAQKSLSGQWDNTPGSLQSFNIESPLSSPGQGGPHPAQISEILKTGKHASLPTKVEGSAQMGMQTQEAKKRRRRESHNMVERRRRDHINERIQELSHLVPQHRLDDEKIRKHLLNNSPLSPTLTATGISPPQATSLLAGGNGRRAAGNITTGLPVEDRDKGPNKGDILNGAVSWTRDLMWALHAKLQQEVELQSYIEQLGGTFPFEQTEDEKRMRTELMDAIEKNGITNFSYSRGPGTGLRVPKHTNMAGEPLSGNSVLSPQSLSPANQSTGSGATAGNQNSYWTGQNDPGSGRGSMIFKEEDEYGMDMS